MMKIDFGFDTGSLITYRDKKGSIITLHGTKLGIDQPTLFVR